jgi:hypothetical protein
MFRKGGGGITGMVKSITFDVKEWKPKKKGGDPYWTLSAKIVLVPDGATKGVDRFVRAGFFYPENQSVSKDGTTLSNGDKGGPVIQADSDFARLIGTLIEKGFPEDRLDPEGLNFSAIIGTRLTIANQIDEDATKEFGKRKGKDGKEYSRDYPVISAVLGLPDAKSAKGGKKVAAEAEPEGEADTTLADTTITALLKAAKGNKLDQGKLKSTLVAYQMDHDTMTKSERDSVYETLTDTDYIKSAVKREVFEFDSDDEVYSAA